MTDESFDDRLHDASRVADVQWHHMGKDLKHEQYCRAAERISNLEGEMQLRIRDILISEGIHAVDWHFCLAVSSVRSGD